MPFPTPSSPSESDPLATRYPLPATSLGLDPFLAALLADQQTLQTPVTRAATAHALQPSAWRAERFRELIPLTAPAPGQQYAFEVDLDACSGCKACVSGCHSLNGLDEEETWRDVGLVYGLSALAAPLADKIINHKSQIINQTVTTACHHCADPACLNGCPVLAYEKDPVTGIVRHLDDQCIGCSYCVLKCPYDVPKYNARLGIVRKCDLCHGRLAAGEAPACAQACPTQAIKIVHVTPSAPTPYDTVIRLPADPAYTQPTTRYVSKKTLPAQLHAADADTLRPQPAHLALVILLVGTQLALGLMFAASLPAPSSPLLAPVAAALYFTALAASVAHLGQPLRAWRIFLGLRRSWLSREAVLLGAAAPFVALTALLPFLPYVGSSLAKTAPSLSSLSNLIGHWSLVIGHSALGLTTLGVACSALIYIDTRRHFWRPANTFTRMGGTVLVAALAFLSAPAAALVLGLKLFAEYHFLRASPVSARLHAGPLRKTSRARLALGLAAVVLFALQQPWFGFLLFAAGELVERVLYFRAVDTPKMPGQAA
ncbi:MAG: dimethyl sulfoxide reductase anchor subunit [Verrucomicrobia bacterium]|nr:dimethyl sulfoxide reductase anchor subunit [Verrucomicrobiota bacterium]